jgi:hypothetical protein
MICLVLVIYLYNTSLLTQLQQLLQRWSYVQCIGQVFLSMVISILCPHP